MTAAIGGLFTHGSMAPRSKRRRSQSGQGSKPTNSTRRPVRSGSRACCKSGPTWNCRRAFVRDSKSFVCDDFRYTRLSHARHNHPPEVVQGPRFGDRRKLVEFVFGLAKSGAIALGPDVKTKSQFSNLGAALMISNAASDKWTTWGLSFFVRLPPKFHSRASKSISLNFIAATSVRRWPVNRSIQFNAPCGLPMATHGPKSFSIRRRSSRVRSWIRRRACRGPSMAI